MHCYRYEGPVLSISGQCATPNWTAETHANSLTKAQNNIKYRYRKEFGLVQKTKIFLPNDVTEVY